MFNLLKRLLGGGGMDEVREAIGRGAVIVDVRTRAEYRGGHVPGSRNVPIDELESTLDALPRDVPIVFCCASGMRSGAASSLAKARGIHALNGGPWTSVASLKSGGVKRP
jgi:rhodanese-related sulfurtransferase